MVEKSRADLETELVGKAKQLWSERNNADWKDALKEDNLLVRQKWDDGAPMITIEASYKDVFPDQLKTLFESINDFQLKFNTNVEAVDVVAEDNGKQIIRAKGKSPNIAVSSRIFLNTQYPRFDCNGSEDDFEFLVSGLGNESAAAEHMTEQHTNGYVVGTMHLNWMHIFPLKDGSGEIIGTKFESVTHLNPNGMIPDILKNSMAGTMSKKQTDSLMEFAKTL